MIVEINAGAKPRRREVPVRAYPRETLTPRDIEVLNLIVADPSATRKQIGEELSIGEDAVKAHLKRIHRVLGCENRAMVYRAWAERGAVRMEEAA